VTVRGVVIAEAGRVGSPPVAVIGDATGGLPVKLPDGVRPVRGTLLDVRGALAAPYGQLELRPVIGGLTVVGTAAVPTPRSLRGDQLGEGTEGSLGRLDGVLVGKPARASSGDQSMTIRASDGTEVRVMADTSAGIDGSTLRDGSSYRLTGIVGQRASKKDALDGYRLWLRDRADVVLLGSASPSASPTASPSTGPAGTPTGVISIARARALTDGAVTVEGVVIADPGLLDSSDRRIVIEDATGGIEVLLPAADPSMPVGRRLRVSGEAGRAYGAPRIRATGAVTLGNGAVTPHDLGRTPTAAEEWRLVRVRGRVIDVKKLGERWRAELQVGADRVVVNGMAGAGIPADRLVEGREATVTGIVRRPYPTATDRRFGIVPRGTADIALGGAGAQGAAPGAPGTSVAAGGSSAPGAAEPSGEAAAGAPKDVDLVALDAALGTLVRVGGLVDELRPDGFTLDDGTATARIVVRGDAAQLLPLIEPGDAVNVIGRPERVADALIVAVEDPAGLLLAGMPEADATAVVGDAPGATAAPSPAPTPLLGGSVGGFGALDPVSSFSGPAGFATLLLATVASGAVALLRRRLRSRRLLAARIRERLATVIPAPPAPD